MEVKIRWVFEFQSKIYMDDFYTDNYILEDSYDLVTKYQLDSVKFSFIMTKHRYYPYSRYLIFKYRHKDKRIAYGKRNYVQLNIDMEQYGID